MEELYPYCVNYTRCWLPKKLLGVKMISLKHLTVTSSHFYNFQIAQSAGLIFFFSEALHLIQLLD